MTPLLAASLWGIINLFLLLFAASVLVSLSKKFSQYWKISPLIVSLILVAFGTNLPEFAVTMGAIARDDSGLAIGNLIGSSVANITLIFGVTVLFAGVKLGTIKTQKNAWMLLAVTILFSGMSILHIDHKLQALLLLAAILAVLTYQFILGIHGRRAEDRLQFAKNKSSGWSSIGLISNLSLLVGSVLLVWFSGEQTVVAITTIAHELNITTTLLGLTLTGVATSLPELLTALTAGFKRENKIVVGTLLGSNIINLSLFPALVFVSLETWFIDYSQFFLLLLSTGLFVWLLLRFRGRKIPKYYGLYLLLVYAIFLLVNVFYQNKI